MKAFIIVDNCHFGLASLVENLEITPTAPAPFPLELCGVTFLFYHALIHRKEPAFPSNEIDRRGLFASLCSVLLEIVRISINKLSETSKRDA